MTISINDFRILNNTHIAASAGTGKTYALASQFLSLLVLEYLKDPKQVDPGKLIAITFTRKAAGEFKDRILTRLAEAAGDENKAKALREDIWKTFHGDPENSACKTSHHDSEENTPLGLAPWLPQEVKNLLTQKTFIELLRQVTNKLARLNLCTIDSLFQQIATVWKWELGQSSFHLLDEALDIPETRRFALQSVYAECLKDEDLLQNFVQAFEQGNQSESDSARVDTALSERIERFHQLFLSAPKESQWGNLQSLGVSESDWAQIADESVRDEVLSAIERTQHTYRLLKQFDDRYQAMVANRGQCQFSDVTRLLSKLAENNTFDQIKSDLEFRMYNKYHSWLLDEFQDTSYEQWNVLEPFIDDAINNGAEGDRSVFIVGDTKQSIYQWRGGNPHIFDRQGIRDGFKNNKFSLPKSHRSAKAVLELVNAIFPKNNLKIQNLEHKVLERWTFEDHKTAKSEEELKTFKGTSQIHMVSPQDTDDKKTDDKKVVVLRDIKNTLDSIPHWQERFSVSVLVVSNKHAVEVKNWLTKHDIPAEICGDTTPGTDSPLGKDLLLFFKWLATPGDNMTKKLLMLSPLWKRIAETQHNVWCLLLERQGYNAVLRELEVSQILQSSPFLQNRFLFWKNQAVLADEQGISLLDWIEHMGKSTLPVDPRKGMVQIMTIHKAKGLGFDIVFLPMLGNNESPTNPKRLQYLVKKDAIGNYQGILLLPSVEVIEEFFPLNAIYHSWREEQEFAELCKLYVALTRAKRATYVVLPELRKKKKQDKKEEKVKDLPFSMWSLLYRTAILEKDSFGDPEWFKSVEHEGKDSCASNESCKLNIKLPDKEPVYYTRKRPSEQADHDTEQQAENAEEQDPVADPLARERALEFGNAVHAVFESITYYDPSDPSAALSAPRSPAERTVAACLQAPAIQALFTPQVSVKVMKEQHIEAIIGDREWVSGVIDRLHVNERDKTAHIIDFKTDKVDTPEQLCERHAKQLRLYAQVVAQIKGWPPESIRCSLISTHLKRVIPVPL